MLSAVSPKGHLHFMVHKGTVNGQRFVSFLEMLLHDIKRPIFLIVDGHPAHRSTPTKAFVEAHADRLKMFFLPAYSPELNPDEQVWNHVKSKTVGRQTPKDERDLRKKVVTKLRQLRRDPEIVRSFFRRRAGSRA